MDLESITINVAKATVFLSAVAGSAYLMYSHSGIEDFKMYNGAGFTVPLIAGIIALEIYEKIRKK